MTVGENVGIMAEVVMEKIRTIHPRIPAKFANVLQKN
jgi:hypothetical protein